MDNGTQEWWFKNHAIEKEIIRPSLRYGDQEWWVNGGLHREGDQPAIIRANGDQEWWVDGERVR